MDVRNRKTLLDDQGGAGSNTGEETAVEKGKKWARGDDEVKGPSEEDHDREEKF